MKVIKIEPIKQKDGYYKCWKCGNPAHVVSNDGSEHIVVMCQTPASYRTSGICGGSYDIPITEDDFLLAKNNLK